MFRPFYQVLETKAKLFNTINNAEWKEHALVANDDKGNP
jgi:hypothetical protein